MDEFAIRVRPGRSTTIVARGELDLATVRRFQAACDSIDFASIEAVVLDLRELDFMDLTGLRAVLRLRAACRERSVDLLITPGPRSVQRVFELTHTDQLFTPRQSARGVCSRRPGL